MMADEFNFFEARNLELQGRGRCRYNFYPRPIRNYMADADVVSRYLHTFLLYLLRI